MSQTATRKRTITTIPATIQMHTQAPLLGVGVRDTVGYARVSTDSEEQEPSFVSIRCYGL